MPKYSITQFKKAETYDELPAGQSSGLGFGVYLDQDKPFDGESMATFMPGQPGKPTQLLSKIMKKLHEEHKDKKLRVSKQVRATVAFEDLLKLSPKLETLLESIYKSQSPEDIRRNLADASRQEV